MHRTHDGVNKELRTTSPDGVSHKLQPIVKQTIKGKSTNVSVDAKVKCSNNPNQTNPAWLRERRDEHNEQTLIDSTQLSTYQYKRERRGEGKNNKAKLSKQNTTRYSLLLIL